VVPENLPAVWWRYPVLVLDGIQNGVLEEIVVLGYLLTKLEQLDWSPVTAVAVSALLRGSYHLYQGFGGFLGNLAMGLIFGVLYLRWRRVTPMIIAHSLVDITTFVGYGVLHGKVSWLP
jgi:membrane protease YdiL (CAAX protease family)